MKSTLETRLGLFFALALIVAFIILEMIGATDIFRPGCRITASFATVQELKKGDQVKLAGVQIGHVERIDLLNGQAVVTMKIHRAYTNQVRTDSRAVVKFSGLMGQNFVAIEGGTTNAPVITENSSLSTVTQPDLGSLMAQLQDVATEIRGMANSFSPTNFSELLGPLTDFIKRNSPVLTAAISNLRSVSDKLAQGQGTVGRLLAEDSLYQSVSVTMSNFQSVSGSFTGLVHQAEVLLSKANGLMDDVKAGRGTLGLLATDERFYREATGALTNLHQILGKINQGQGSVGKLVNDESFLKNAKMSLQKLDKATDSLEDQGPLSVLGIAINTLF
jgi:phospholipid/cholesterol/gamma-HCH transport system substrate-binding protein